MRAKEDKNDVKIVFSIADDDNSSISDESEEQNNKEGQDENLPPPPPPSGQGQGHVNGAAVFDLSRE